jgi:CHAD domain-containing protein
MAYRLKADESVPEGIKRIVKEEFDSALGQLSGNSRGNVAVSIHEARKSVKKIRAVLRLIRAELAGDYQSENRRLQAVGRKLSELRDAGVMVETLDKVKAKYHDQIGGHSLDLIRRGIVARKKQAEKQAKTGKLFAQLAGTLRGCAKRVNKWRLHTDGFAAIAPGLEESFRRARKAMAQARKHPQPENYHQWRKRVKDHWYHVRLLKDLPSDAIRVEEKSLKRLDTLLGDDHNLVVLRENITAEPLPGLIDKFQNELRASALSLGERIYEERPRQFTTRMKHLWKAWRAQPKHLERRPTVKTRK